MLSNGQILRERYRIVRCIGRGGTSSVYMAEDVTLITNNMAHFSRIRGLKLENWVLNA